MKFDFEQTGDGPALLFLPGSYSNARAWRAVSNALEGTYRVITTSLPGYGGSAEVRTDAVADMDEATDFVARVVDEIAAPVHLVGHSYGGLCAFASVMSGKIAPLSMITFEANPIYSRPDTGAFPWLAAINAMKVDFEAAYACGDPETAGIIIDFWSSQGTFANLPDVFRQYCRDTVFSNVLDWRGATGFQPLLSDYGKIDLPCTLVRSEHANPAMIELTQAMHNHIPQSALEVVAGANHFLTTSHPGDCAALIDQHMQGFLAEG